MYFNMKKLILILLFLPFCFSCSKKDNIIIEFNPIENIQSKDKSLIEMDIDLDGVVHSGIIIPSVNQSKDGLFHFSARVNVQEGKEYFYKIYYQNESYKFEEDNPLANENFYGSWEDTDIEFKPMSQDGVIKDSFRILGNPRNEKVYFGQKTPTQVTQEDIINGMEMIKRDENWYKAIKEKAIKNNISVEKQLYLDMSWILKNPSQSQEENNRWKRNPRAGEYSFMLVVVEKEVLNSIPKEVRNISLSDSISGFTNPYSYFKYGKGKNLKGVNYIISPKKLKLRAHLNPQKGVYVDILKYPDNNFRIHKNNGWVGNSDSLYNNALYEQFFHTISKSYSLKNIPLVEDNYSYTQEDYKKNSIKYSDSLSRIYSFPFVTDYPGKTVKVSDNRDYISLINPGNGENNTNPKKESVGVITRVGFTYGKFRGKIKFPAQLNPYGVWSGLTNAFWLIYQSDSPWNERRICKDKGYVKPGLEVGEDAGRTERANYSEIDIEIIKTSKYWPEETKIDKNYNPFSKDECILACTNWDLACPNPKKFHPQGLQTLKYLDNLFTLHRWSEAYRAITIRTPIQNKIFQEDFYYFEIEWKPNEIIWRLGKDEKNMRIVGYMNDKVTSIPNNQMVSVITQEYHYTEYWPPIIYDQNLIPFPKNDIEGRIFDIVIE